MSSRRLKETFTFKKEELEFFEVRSEGNAIQAAGFMAKSSIDRIRKEGWSGLIRTTFILTTSDKGIEELQVTIEEDLGDSFLGEGI